MSSSQPQPISWPPAEYWDGFDGPWSSFALQVGSPPQIVRVLPATSGQATWVISPQGCPDKFGPECTQTRGGVFNSFLSESWSNRGDYAIGMELNLGYNDNSTYGLDTVALDFTNTSGLPVLESHLVGEIETFDFPMGLFGLGQQKTNLSTFTDGYPSFLTRLKMQNLIPSLSWSYTAGARYRLKGVFGSLVFGGYDLSRFEPNNVSFSFAPDTARDLVVGLQAINSVSISSAKTTQLLPSPILTFVDSTIPWIYLPSAACQAFEQHFGLQFNSTLQSYTVTEAQHDALVADGVNISFTVGNSEQGGPTVDIVLPYASFDLELEPPLAPEKTRYFPILPAQNESQFTLGRAFLQEAYLAVNYENFNFSISQCVFEDGAKENIIPIRSAKTEEKYTSGSKATIGGTLGTAVFLLLSLLALVLTRRRWRRSKTNVKTISSPQLDPYNPDFSTRQHTPEEVGSNSLAAMRDGHREMDDTALAELAQASRLMLLSQSGAGIGVYGENPNATSSGTVSRLELPSPAIQFLQRDPMHNSKREHNCRACEIASPSALVSPRSRTSLLDRPLPPTPSDSARNASVFHTHPRRNGRLDEVSGNLSRDNVKEWIRTGTPF